MAVGQLASQYGVACAMCMWGVVACFSFSAPSLANVSAISFPMMHVWLLLCVCVFGVVSNKFVETRISVCLYGLVSCLTYMASWFRVLDVL